MKIIKIPNFWKRIRINWSTKYRLIIKNDATHEDKFALRLSPKNIFIVVVSSAFILITLTTILIAFTPLRYYSPGYTNPNEYRLYKTMVVRMDSLQNIIDNNQRYLDNFYNVINEINVEEEENENKEGSSQREINKEDLDNAKAELIEQEEFIIREITNKDEKGVVPLTQRAIFKAFAFYPPAIGVISEEYNIYTKHNGIDISNSKGTPITAIADGVIVFAGFTAENGNTIIIHHSGDVISTYQCVDKILKKVGDKVTCKESIATMGNSGTENDIPHLHFEIWYNGFPVNPLSYITIN